MLIIISPLKASDSHWWGSGLNSVDASVTSTGKLRLLGGANTVTVINSIVDELTDEGADVAKKLTLVRHTGELDEDSASKAPEKQFKLVINENTARSFDTAQLKLEFSGIPDDIEVEIDAWVTTQAFLTDDDDDTGPDTRKLGTDLTPDDPRPIARFPRNK